MAQWQECGEPVRQGLVDELAAIDSELASLPDPTDQRLRQQTWARRLAAVERELGIPLSSDVGHEQILATARVIQRAAPELDLGL